MKAPVGAPNVLIWIMDDIGFGQLSPFGGLIPMPNLERLAAKGLRYSNFHSTPLCSPSRAALLTGRNSHSVHMGSHAATPMPFPGYDAVIPPSAATTAKVLLQNGYATMAIGKWDHVPTQYVSPTGPFDLWPRGQGFEHFYGFMSYETDNHAPTLYSEHTPLVRKEFPKDYHLTTDMADEAISFVNSIQSAGWDKPFYLYWATGANHAPHHAPQDWIARFAGKFDMGWDEYHDEVFARQKRMGVVPAHARLPSRPAELPAWSSLSSQERKLYAKQMEVFAAQIAHADHEFGRILDRLERDGSLDNTIVIVTSDNGATAEGGLAGLWNATGIINGRAQTFEENMQRLEEWGGPKTAPHYHSAWAFAGNTPYRYYKHLAHRGGHQVPTIVSWPKGIRNHGEVRTQYQHLIDLSPTILKAAGITPPACVDGVVQQPIDGVAINYTFDSATAPSKRDRQYYELWGNRAIYDSGWSAVVAHKVTTWKLRVRGDFSKDQWELYDVRKDPTQTVDLSEKMPAKLSEMKRIFDEEARKFNVYPLDDDLAKRLIPSSPRKSFEYLMPGPEGFDSRFAPSLFMRDYEIKVDAHVPAGAGGVLLAHGGAEAGYSLYIKDDHLYYEFLDLDGRRYTLVSNRPVPAGEAEVLFRFTHASGGSGIGELFLNGVKVAEGSMQQSVITAYSGSELFNIGLDSGAPVSESYSAPNPFNGAISKVAFELGVRE